MTIRIEGANFVDLMSKLPRQPNGDIHLTVTPLCADYKLTGKTDNYRVYCKRSGLVSDHKTLDEAMKEMRKHVKRLIAKR